MKLRGALIIGVLAVIGLANNESDSTRTTSTKVAVTQPAEKTFDEVPTSTPEPRVHHRRHLKLTACDANIRVKASTTTCPFAQNVFYEYWAGGSPSSITAYSPASGDSIDLDCTERSVVTCRADDGSYVRFALAAVGAYDEEQAADYACSHDLGPETSAPCADNDPAGGEAGDGCDQSYVGECLDPGAYDYDCDGGSGDGPEYTGQVEVVGDDHYDLDRDGDGIACDDSYGSAGDDESYDDVYGDSSAPTTEDFGSGSGSVGTCADGTLSDSIGRPGACSHHGGVG